MPLFNLNAAEALKRVGQFDSDTGTPERMAAWFKDPPIQYRSLPFYWLNGKLDAAALRDQIQAMRDQCGFGGFSPLPMRSTQPAYLTDEYFDQYRGMLEMAEKLGLKVIFYDDIDFPTGTATYAQTFRVTLALGKDQRLYLDLGDVRVMARVTLNGKGLGTVWTAPFRVDVTEAVRTGDNALEISVANLWPNRTIGDQFLPQEKRHTWSTWNPFNKTSPLLESGLLGPLTLQTTR
jgi:hypothetical protein